ncbi:MAG: hypothetical protein Q4P13_08665 [Psychrobacter sp.]|nr:hypothetical protein [Psychrobacter sp.]
MKTQNNNNRFKSTIFKTIFNIKVAKRALQGVGVLSVGALAATAMMSAQAAPITESAVQSYAAAMKSAANSKNVNQVASLVSDDALISLSRKGKTTSLDKDAYLKLLQSSWGQTQGYRYDITVNNVVIAGDQAKADVKTIETWTKDGQQVSFVTSSRVTLTSNAGNAVLLRAVSQVTIN